MVTWRARLLPARAAEPVVEDRPPHCAQAARRPRRCAGAGAVSSADSAAGCGLGMPAATPGSAGPCSCAPQASQNVSPAAIGAEHAGH